MRFHHSTRRGRNRFSQGGNHHSAQGGKFGAGSHSLSNRWAQLSYCRQTNIHFNRRLEVELPDAIRERISTEPSGYENIDNNNNRLQQQPPQATMLLDQGFTSEARGGSNQTKAAAAELADCISRVDLEQLDRLSLAPGDGGEPATAHEQQQQQQQRKSSVRRKKEIPQQHNKQESEGKPLTPRHASVSKQQAGGKLDLEGAREKLIAQVDKHPFWSSKAARRMRLLDVHERQIYIYELVSYCEKRDLEWRYEAYRGGRLGSGPFGASASVVPGVGLLRPATASGCQQRPAQGPLSTPPSPGSESTGRLLLRTPSGGETAHAPSIDQIYDQETITTTECASAQSANGKPLLTNTTSHNSAVQRPHQFAYEIPTAGSRGLSRHQHQTKASSQHIQLQQQSAARLRRSFSSATSSPVRRSTSNEAQPEVAAMARETNPVAQSLSLSNTILTPNLAAEPRPLPSPETVWSIEPPEHMRPNPFASYVHTSEVPGTSFVKRCHGCDGRGRHKCTSCYGVGYEVCLSCTGKGSLRSYSAMSAGGGLGSAARSGLGARFSSGGGAGDSRSRDQSSGVTGSMWANAEDSSRLGGGRHDEPGGITSASSEICANCSGAGQKRCWICAGRSFITCTACAGTGSLRCFLNLNITYANHRDEVCLNNSDGIIPRDRLKLSSGLLLADETANRLQPLASGGVDCSRDTASRTPTEGAPSLQHSQQQQHHSQQQQQYDRHSQQATASSGLLEQVARPGELIQLSMLSAKLLDKHRTTHRHERLIKQRQRVTQIECFVVDWEFRKKRGHFVVYGDERKVYIAKYPFKSICNIT